MAEVLMIRGKPETIFEPRDFEYLVDKELGYDAARYFRELVEGLEKAADENEAKTNTDLGSYEASLESNTTAFQDIEDVCRSMIAEFNLEEGRNKLAALRPWRNKIEQIIKIINNQI